MRVWLAVDFSQALRFLRGCALAAACSLAASACALGGWILVLCLASVAQQQPELFMVAVFAASLWLFVRLAFSRRVEN